MQLCNENAPCPIVCTAAGIETIVKLLPMNVVIEHFNSATEVQRGDIIAAKTINTDVLDAIRNINGRQTVVHKRTDRAIVTGITTDRLDAVRNRNISQLIVRKCAVIDHGDTTCILTLVNSFSLS